MPPTSVSLQQIKRMYREVRDLTKSFAELRPELLEENASRILILRLALKMSQNEFEKFIEAESKNISKYERGKIAKMKKETAEKYTQKIKTALNKNKITEEAVILAYRKIRYIIFSCQSKFPDAATNC